MYVISYQVNSIDCHIGSSQGAKFVKIDNTQFNQNKEAWRALRSLQHTATHCNTLQHIATHCNTLQHTATQIYLNPVERTLGRTELGAGNKPWIIMEKFHTKKQWHSTHQKGGLRTRLHSHGARCTSSWLMPHPWMSHVTHRNKPRHTNKWVMSRVWMHPVTHIPDEENEQGAMTQGAGHVLFLQWSAQNQNKMHNSKKRQQCGRYAAPAYESASIPFFAAPFCSLVFALPFSSSPFLPFSANTTFNYFIFVVYVYVYIYIYVYIYMYLCVCVYICVYIYVYIYLYIYVYIYTYMHL